MEDLRTIWTYIIEFYLGIDAKSLKVNVNNFEHRAQNPIVAWKFKKA